MWEWHVNGWAILCTRWLTSSLLAYQVLWEIYLELKWSGSFEEEISQYKGQLYLSTSYICFFKLEEKKINWYLRF